MNEHYIVAADAGHLRIYAERRQPGQYTPGYEQVEALDFPAGRAAYTDRDSDVAGRFQSSKSQASGAGQPAARAGMSIDERLLRLARTLALHADAPVGWGARLPPSRR